MKGYLVKMRILGLDIGGTAIKWGISEGGELVDTGTCPSFASSGAERLFEVVFSLLDSLRFDMLGVSTAGIVAPDGSIRYANENIPRYTGVRLKALLEERYSVPVAVLNDIAAAAYSERSSLDDYYYVALGTGVGGIYVKDGVVLSGASGVAGQIGYLPSQRGGIIDLDASTRGLGAACGGDVRGLFASAKGGDATAERILDDWCGEVAAMLTQIVGYINPRVIVIGGGISEQGDALLDRIRHRLADIPEPYRGSFEIRVATGGNLAAVNGIINYVKEVYHEHFREN